MRNFFLHIKRGLINIHECCERESAQPRAVPRGSSSDCQQPSEHDTIRYDTIEDINVDSKAAYTA